MKRRIVGYAVEHERHGIQELYFDMGIWDAPPSGILLKGEHGTVFPTYDTARNAIRRTVRFAKRKTFAWGQKDYYQIVSLRRL